MKTQNQENFPVACCLFPRHLRRIITDYYNFARYCDDIADNKQLSSEKKLTFLNEAENTLTGHGELPVATILRQDFLEENLDFSLATDLLIAFRRDAENIKYQTWAQLLDYCKYSAAPVGRFILALYNENPSTYLPGSALCSVLQIVNHIQDLREDVHILDRVYIPSELMHKHKVSLNALKADKCSKNLHFLLNDILNRCRGLMKDAQILPTIVKSKRLRIYLGITLSMTEILIDKLVCGDVLAQKIKLTKFDRFKAIIKGIGNTLFIRRKTLTNKGF